MARVQYNTDQSVANWCTAMQYVYALSEEMNQLKNALSFLIIISIERKLLGDSISVAC